MRNAAILAFFAADELERITTAQICVALTRIQCRLVNLKYDQFAAWDQLATETRARFSRVTAYYPMGAYTAERHRAQARRLLGGAA